MSDDWRAQALDAYRRHRVDDQITYYGARAVELERARRWTVSATAGLLVLAALAGALGAVYGPQRAMWAFVAATLAAVASAISGFEAAFGFERFSRRANETAAALALADTNGPIHAESAADLLAFIQTVERLLRSEVDTWSHLAAKPEDSTGGDGT